MAWLSQQKHQEAIIDRLNKEINLALKDPEVKVKFQSVGIDTRGGACEEFRSILAKRNCEMEKTLRFPVKTWKNFNQ
jgi:tripartite-type tricarboxylate transporter receptor subunit TctC